MQLDQARPALLADIPEGERGTEATLRMMRSLVHQYKKAGLVRETALTLVNGLRQKDWVGEVRNIFEWVRDHVRYVRDIHGIETLQTPLVTLDNGTGDCDDKSTLLAALLESIGHPTRFVAAGYREPHNYSHVYVETRLGTRWVPLDATLLDKPMGSIPRPPVARFVIHN
jgi:transglutaminase-like putative cysteine protease